MLALLDSPTQQQLIHLLHTHPSCIHLTKISFTVAFDQIGHFVCESSIWDKEREMKYKAAE
jgi:hypothetical protein